MTGQEAGGALRRPLLSVAMVVGDETDELIRCLNNLGGLFDELCIVITGTSPQTVEVAKSFGAKILMSRWQADFAFHRSQALDMASYPPGLWQQDFFWKPSEPDPDEIVLEMRLEDTTGETGPWSTRVVLKRSENDGSAEAREWGVPLGLPYTSLRGESDDGKLAVTVFVRNRKPSFVSIPTQCQGVKDLAVLVESLHSKGTEDWLDDEPMFEVLQGKKVPLASMQGGAPNPCEEAEEWREEPPLSSPGSESAKLACYKPHNPLPLGSDYVERWVRNYRLGERLWFHLWAEEKDLGWWLDPNDPMGTLDFEVEVGPSESYADGKLVAAGGPCDGDSEYGAMLGFCGEQPELLEVERNTYSCIFRVLNLTKKDKLPRPWICFARGDDFTEIEEAEFVWQPSRSGSAKDPAWRDYFCLKYAIPSCETLVLIRKYRVTDGGQVKEVQQQNTLPLPRRFGCYPDNFFSDNLRVVAPGGTKNLDYSLVFKLSSWDVSDFGQAISNTRTNVFELKATFSHWWFNKETQLWEKQKVERYSDMLTLYVQRA